MKILIKNKHWNLSKDYNLDKILYLLIDRPSKKYNRSGIDITMEYTIHTQVKKLPAFIQKKIKEDNGKFYHVNHEGFVEVPHREYDLPATMCYNHDYVGTFTAWGVKGISHRSNNKPSKIFDNGKEEYHINGITVRTFFNKELNLKERCTAYELREKYNLNLGCLSKIIKGKRKSHKGWELFKE